uniref:Uncharacterized protein n=1 Tax=Rhizophora mucronata TaxID=61149 RepID=A0A2P2PCD0_RHIMU
MWQVTRRFVLSIFGYIVCNLISFSCFLTFGL